MSERKTQAEKFRDAAREAETDDSDVAFDATLKKVAKTPSPIDKRPSKDRQ